MSEGRNSTAILRIFIMLLLASCSAFASAAKAEICREAVDSVSSSTPTVSQELTLRGLSSPAVVSGSLQVEVGGQPAHSSMVFCIDNASVRPAAAKPASTVITLSLRDISPGPRPLSAVAVLQDGRLLRSQVVHLVVVPSPNAQFSNDLTPYALQPSAIEALPDLLSHVATPGAHLSGEEIATRQEVAAMYRNFGVDLSLDSESDQSEALLNLLPSHWKAPAGGVSENSIEQMSPDASFYKAIPSAWPRVKLPKGYLSTVQLNTAHGGDGIGYGVVIAQENSPPIRITSQWYGQVATRRVVETRGPANWPHLLPSLPAGDRHMLFIDPGRGTFVSAYKTSVDGKTGAPNALYAGPVTPLNSLGDHGGSIAAGFAEIPLLLWPGEATSNDREIRHALGGPVSRVWAARVYPATARDAGVLTSTNTCPGKSQLMTNTGLVPYGGVIQLDPSLDLASLGLSRPAQRILRAIQVYGYYVMDFGCADLDIYTAVDEKEFEPFGGLYGWNATHPGVQAEVSRVLTSATLYVVAPVVKRP